MVDRERGKPSQTRWRVFAFDAARDATRLELEPVTGRSHQLRVHLQALGHPILGDSLYAPPEVQARCAAPVAARQPIAVCASGYRRGPGLLERRRFLKTRTAATMAA